MIITNTESVVCPICFGTMQRVGRAKNLMVKMARYRCTCGHYEDLPDQGSEIHGSQTKSGLPEGIEEI